MNPREKWADFLAKVKESMPERQEVIDRVTQGRIVPEELRGYNPGELRFLWYVVQALRLIEAHPKDPLVESANAYAEGVAEVLDHYNGPPGSYRTWLDAAKAIAALPDPPRR